MTLGDAIIRIAFEALKIYISGYMIRVNNELPAVEVVMELLNSKDYGHGFFL